MAYTSKCLGAKHMNIVCQDMVLSRLLVLCGSMSGIVALTRSMQLKGLFETTKGARHLAQQKVLS